MATMTKQEINFFKKCYLNDKFLKIHLEHSGTYTFILFNKKVVVNKLGILIYDTDNTIIYTITR